MPERADLPSRLRTIYNQFTPAEKKVADYILANPHEVLFQSITELADACGVGETSVFRFCRTVGLRGYQEFKMQLSLGLSRTGQTEDGDGPTGDISRQDSLSAVIRKLLRHSEEVLEETAALVIQADLERAVELLTQARRILFFGVGASLTAALTAHSKFLRIEPKVLCVNDAHMQAMVAATTGPEDVAVVFSYSGSTMDTNSVAKLVKQNGAAVIAVTRFRKSPLTEFTDIALLYGVKESPLQGGSSSAAICQAFLVELLYTEYFRRNYDRCSNYIQTTSASVLDKLY